MRSAKDDIRTYRARRPMTRVRRLHRCGGHILSGLLASFAYGAPTWVPAGTEVRPPLTVADAIETARFQEDRDGRAVFPSPDGRRYVFFVIFGDIKNDGIWLNVYSGEKGSLASATPRLVSTHFTSGLPETGPIVDSTAGPSALIAPMGNLPVWISNEEIAYLWADDRGRNQIFSLSVRSGKLRQLTHEELDVVAFTAGSNGSLAYDAKVSHTDNSAQNFRSGFSVKSPDINMLLAGIVDGTSLYDLEMCRRSVATRSNGEYAAKPLRGSEIKCELSELLLTPGLISPDGRRLIINTHVKEFPAEWSSYRGAFGRALKDAQENRAGLAAEAISEFVVVDLAGGTYRSLWNAPAGLGPWSFVAWSPDSTRVLVAPTMLPAKEIDAASLEGEAMAIVDAETGKYQRVSIDQKIAAGVGRIDWPREREFVLTVRDGTSIRFVQKSGRWSRVPSGSADENVLGGGTRDIRVGIDQALERPPRVVGTDMRSGRHSVLFDPNPNLTASFALGHVEMAHWMDSRGLPWEGRLYYPAHFVPGRRYPLVIQTHGYARKDEFSIYGMGYPRGGVSLGPGWSVYLAQPLAGRDIAVLQIGGPEVPPTRETDFSRSESKALALADAANHLVALGLVDKDRIGIMGHSATGRVVEAALASTDFPYAAAIVSDNYELNYTQSMYLGWNVIDGQPPPFGQGLEVWLDTAPAFNAERIRTPLQLDLTTGAAGSTTLVYPWEMFSRLRYLKKPVEYYVLPDLAHASHLVQNPRQLLALQNRALDWWLFWLKAEEDPQAEKMSQYRDWRLLRAMHIEDLRRPRAPARKWVSTVSGSN